MEVKINNSIDIQTPVKKRRPRISDNANKYTEDVTAYVKSTNFTNDNAEKSEKRSKNKKRESFKRPKRTVEDIKEGINKSLETTGGKYVAFDDVNHTEGILVCGIVDADNLSENVSPKDIYFAVINHDRKLVYISSNERYSVMREPSMKCSILDWLYRNDTEFINAIAYDGMENDGVEIFTDVYLREPVQPKPINNKKKKSNKKNSKKS